MKLSNTVVSILIIAAVLVFAYAVGLMIRQARTGGPAVPPSSVGKEKGRSPEVSHGPRAAQTRDTPEERERVKSEKAKALEKMRSWTPEEKEQFQSQVRKQFGAQRGSKKPQDLPPEGLQARQTGMRSESAAGRPKEDANAPASSGKSGGSTNTEPGTEKAGAEPGKAGPG